MTLIKKLNVHDYEFFSILQITYLLTYMGDGSIISAIAVPPCSEPVARCPFAFFGLATGLPHRPNK